jgi:WD40 repeat protein
VKGHFGEMPFEVGRYPHTSPIQAIWAIPGTVDTLCEGCEEEELHIGLSSAARYLTGDKEGLIATWRLVYNKHSEVRLKLVSLLDVSTLEPTPVSASVRSVCERNGTILLGTIGSEIYEVLDDSIPSLTDAFRALKKKRNDRHAALQASVGPPAYTASQSIAEAFARSESSNSAHTALTITASSNHSHSNLNLSAICRVDGRGDDRGVTVPSLRLISGHHRGELWGLATHPSLPIYMTCGDDGTIRCWSLLQHKLLTYLKLPEQIRAIDIHPVDGSELAVSLNSGAVWVINAKLLLNPRNVPLIEVDTTLSGCEVFISKEALERANMGAGTALSAGQSVSSASAEKRGSIDVRAQRVDLRILASKATMWAKEVKYCFDGSTLAVGSYERKIYLYDVNNSYAPRETVSPPIALGYQEGQVHSSTLITHIDFGVILPYTPGTDVTYDENSRKIITSQWQALPEMDGGTRTLGTMGSIGNRIESEARLKMTSSSSRLLETQGMGQGQGQGQGQGKKKAGKLVVLSTRDLTAKDICMQSVCGTGELLYWNLDGTRIQSVETVKVRK